MVNSDFLDGLDAHSAAERAIAAAEAAGIGFLLDLQIQGRDQHHPASVHVLAAADDQICPFFLQRQVQFSCAVAVVLAGGQHRVDEVIGDLDARQRRRLCPADTGTIARDKDIRARAAPPAIPLRHECTLPRVPVMRNLQRTRMNIGRKDLRADLFAA